MLLTVQHQRTLLKLPLNSSQKGRYCTTLLTTLIQMWLAHPLRPDFSWYHGLLRSNGGHEVLLGQEVQRKLHQEATDFAKLLLSASQVGLGQTRFGLVLLQLRHVPHQG